MGCCGEREKFGDLKSEQKWEYINLNDFKSSSCWAGFAYGYLWVMLFFSISVYAVDTFTAINLLAFDRWQGQIKPKIPLNISRWIFAGCIILSFVLLIYRWIRAIRVMKQGGVAKSYLDPLAVRLQSIRMGREGRGWKRFLVFAELTKSRKGADYVALFTFYSFEAWLRIVFAEGPRQVVNAITLYSVMQLNLIPQGQHAAKDGHSPIIQFFVNIGVMADSNKLQVAILFGMLWTLVIWVISALSLAVSLILYLLFLWHHIPSEDGSLTKYCRNKIDRRMARIVKAKVDKALKKENEIRARKEALEAREGFGMKKQPTLPNLDGTSSDPTPGLSRQTTMTTLPEYSSRPHTGRDSNESFQSQPTLPDLYGGRPAPVRTMTHASEASVSSYTSNVPLISGASDMGYAPPERSYTPGSATSGSWNGRPAPNRSMTGASQFSQRSYGSAQARPGTAQGGWNPSGGYPLEPIPRTGTGMSNGSRRTPSESDSNYPPPSAVSTRGPSWDSPTDSQGRKTPGAVNNPYFPPIPEAQNGRNSPAPGAPLRSQAPSRGPMDRSYTPSGPPPRTWTPASAPTLPRLQTSSSNHSGYTAFSPEPRSMTPASAGGPDPAYRSYSRNEGGYGRPPPAGHQPSEPRSMTPASAGGPDPAYRSYSKNEGGYGRPPPAGHQPSQSGYPLRPAPQRQDSNGVDDLLDHY